MARGAGHMKAFGDPFKDIARYYDRIMEHVDYDRWFGVTTMLAELLPAGFRHLDTACGTGTLLKMLRRSGWGSVGTDGSPSMLLAGCRKSSWAPPVAVADLRGLPFRGSLDYVTCLFDSVNFLLNEEDLRRAFVEVAGALRPGGLFYFDVVTELMVTQHFENQEWTERSGRLTTTWRSAYTRKSALAETEIHVGSGAGGVFREHIFGFDELERALENAGLTLLGQFDALSWKAPGKHTTRVDFIAAKEPGREMRRGFKRVRSDVRRLLR